MSKIAMKKEQQRKLYEEIEDNFNAQIINSLKEESDRAKIILAASWADNFLSIKLENEFSKGNKEAHKNLFSANGPFSTFSSKLNVAYCAGWLDSDVYQDIQIIRKLRNDCAHSIDSFSLDHEKIRKEIEKFKVPKRKYHDWNKIWVVSTGNTIKILSGKKPQNAEKELYFTGNFALLCAIPVILFVLLSNLEIPIFTDENNVQKLFTIGLPDYMKEF